MMLLKKYYLFKIIKILDPCVSISPKTKTLIPESFNNKKLNKKGSCDYFAPSFLNFIRGL